MADRKSSEPAGLQQRTYGQGQCSFHAAFGIWDPKQDHNGGLFFAENHSRMRTCFVRFLEFFNSVEEMGTTTKLYALGTLADFYNNGCFPASFKPSVELRTAIDELKIIEDTDINENKKAQTTVLRNARAHLAETSPEGVGTSIFKIISPSLSNGQNPLSAFMSERPEPENDPGGFWSALVEWEKTNEPTIVNTIILNNVQAVVKLLINDPLEPDLELLSQYYTKLTTKDDKQQYRAAIYALPRLWQAFSAWVKSQSLYYFLSTWDLGLVSEISGWAIHVHHPERPTPTMVYTPSTNGSGLTRTRNSTSTEFNPAEDDPEGTPFPSPCEVDASICHVAHDGNMHYTRFCLFDLSTRFSSYTLFLLFVLTKSRDVRSLWGSASRPLFVPFVCGTVTSSEGRLLCLPPAYVCVVTITHTHTHTHTQRAGRRGRDPEASARISLIDSTARQRSQLITPLLRKYPLLPCVRIRIRQRDALHPHCHRDPCRRGRRRIRSRTLRITTPPHEPRNSVDARPGDAITAGWVCLGRH